MCLIFESIKLVRLTIYSLRWWCRSQEHNQAQGQLRPWTWWGGAKFGTGPSRDVSFSCGHLRVQIKMNKVRSIKAPALFRTVINFLPSWKHAEGRIHCSPGCDKTPFKSWHSAYVTGPALNIASWFVESISTNEGTFTFQVACRCCI